MPLFCLLFLQVQYVALTVKQASQVSDLRHHHYSAEKLKVRGVPGRADGEGPQLWPPMRVAHSSFSKVLGHVGASGGAGGWRWHAWCCPGQGVGEEGDGRASWVGGEACIRVRGAGEPVGLTNRPAACGAQPWRRP